MSRAGATPPGGRRPPSREERHRARKPWWRRAPGIVLAAGALAAAVTAVITLVMTLMPDPDPVDRVTIMTAALTPQPLSGYAATAVLRPLPPDGGGADVVAVLPELLSADTTTATTGADIPSSTPSTSPPAETSGDEPTETTDSDPSTTSSPPTTTSGSSTTSSAPPTTASDSSTTSSPGSQPPDFTPSADISATLGTEEQTDFYCDVLEQPTVVDVELPTCAETRDVDVVVEGDGAVHMSPPLPAPGNALLDDEGRPATPEIAATRLATSLDGVRSVRTRGKVDPLGMRATVTLEIEGMRDRTLALYWRLSAAPGGTVLPAEWATAVPACRLVPGTDLDSASIDLWIPLPEPSGPFLMDLYVATETTALTSYRTEPFD